ncbi:MAG TPA: hypothetical protein VL907_01685 [Pyrinomonadaceae bacterium]|nr:hypothetical protein [Pyrinomonadaceae bacterium]
MQQLHAEYAHKYKSGAGWFYWIAGLTLITSIITFAGGNWRFLISLGTTQIIDGIAAGVAAELGGSAPKIIALFLDMILTAVFVVFGVLANKRLLWAYILGMAIFVIDGLISLIMQDLIGVVAHVVVLVFMVPGFLAGKKMLELEQEMAAQVPSSL